MFYLIYPLIFLSLSSPVFAHGGGLNSEGCHNNRKTGDYHCHRGPKAKTKRRSSSKQEVLVGIPKVTDGDTIRIGNTRIRLHGIDAPEAKQTCASGGKEWRCGWEGASQQRLGDQPRVPRCPQRSRRQPRQATHSGGQRAVWATM